MSGRLHVLAASVFALLMPTLTAGQAPENAPATSPGYLGIIFDVVPEGLIVNRVVPDTPAAAQGIQVGDVILRYDDVDLTGIESTEAFRRHFDYLRAGEAVEALVRRGEAVREVTWVLGERPARVTRAYHARDNQSLFVAGFQSLFRLLQPVVRAGDPLALRQVGEAVMLGAPAHGTPFRPLTEGERLVLDVHAFEALSAAIDAPGTCVRLWFNARPDDFSLQRHEVASATETCP